MVEHPNKRKLNQEARRALRAESLRFYLQQVGRKASNGGGDPNDRR